jgi:hypothetical protein
VTRTTLRHSTRAAVGDEVLAQETMNESMYVWRVVTWCMHLCVSICGMRVLPAPSSFSFTHPLQIVVADEDDDPDTYAINRPALWTSQFLVDNVNFWGGLGGFDAIVTLLEAKVRMV